LYASWVGERELEGRRRQAGAFRKKRKIDRVTCSRDVKKGKKVTKRNTRELEQMCRVIEEWYGVEKKPGKALGCGEEEKPP